MTLQLPGNARIAVAIGADFDAHSAWMGAFGLTSPSYLSRGEFGAEVGVPRLLDLFRRFEVKATFCTPGHSIVTFPSRIEQILKEGHEIAGHGCYHESIPKLDADLERRLMELQLAQYAQVVGGRPRGYRSPAWDFSESTLGLLEEFGFEWDSSLMGRDFEPYHPRPVTVNWESANQFGPPSRLLEIPVSWYLDDWPSQEYVAGVAAGLGDHDVLYRRWKDTFDYAREHVSAGVYALTVHPQCIGRAHLIGMFERLISYMRTFDDVLFCTLSDVYDYWVEDSAALSPGRTTRAPEVQ
ncbi:MAG: polysaccharide deacetylase family protein [Streptosporangiaceae bacterium]